MPEGQLIEFSHVTKRFGGVTAVDDFSAQIVPGSVTGFLGPNGAGKTTTLRILLGLVRPSAGTATIGGTRYADLRHPLQTVGAALEASSFHPGRSGAGHLKIYALAGGIPLTRVDDVLGLVGLSDVAGRKVGGYSLGMRQRLGLAAAMLGDPGVVVLDEPANGLDPEGIRWMRTFLRQLAREGRTVLTSSHLLAEVQQTAHALVIIAQGRLVFAGRLYELSAHDETSVVVDSPDRAALVDALRKAEIPFQVLRAGLTVRGGDPTSIGALAAEAGVALSSLQKRTPALEEVFLELVSGLRVHPSANGIAGTLEAGSSADAARAEAAEAAAEEAEAEAAQEAAPAFPAHEQRAAVPDIDRVPGDDTAPAEDPASDADPVRDESGSDGSPGEDGTGPAAPDGRETAASTFPERPLPGISGLAAAAAAFTATAPADAADGEDTPREDTSDPGEAAPDGPVDPDPLPGPQDAAAPDRPIDPGEAAADDDHPADHEEGGQR